MSYRTYHPAPGGPIMFLDCRRPIITSKLRWKSCCTAQIVRYTLGSQWWPKESTVEQCIVCGAQTERVFDSADQWWDSDGVDHYREFTYGMCAGCEEE